MGLFKLNQKGISLVQLVMGMAVGAVVLIGIGQVSINLSRANQGVSEKLAALDLQRFLSSAFTISGSCDFVLADPSQASTASPSNRSADAFDGTSLPQTISLQRLVTKDGTVYAAVGQSLSPQVNTAVVSAIRLTMTSGKDKIFFATLQVDLDPTRSTHPLSSPAVNLTIATDGIAPTHQNLKGCIMGTPPAANKSGFTYWVSTPAGNCQLDPLPNASGYPSYPVSNWVPAYGGNIGANRSCFAFVASAYATYRYNSGGCYYNPTDGQIYACATDTNIRCGWICAD